MTARLGESPAAAGRRWAQQAAPLRTALTDRRSLFFVRVNKQRPYEPIPFATRSESARRRPAAPLRKAWAGFRIFPVVQPLHGILGDVEADGVEFLGAAHDMFVIVSLPDGPRAMECPIDGCSREGFEGA